MRCIMLTHKLNTKISDHMWDTGIIHICSGAFIGTNTIICNTIRIGKNSIIGAGSVVTKNIPDNEIWAGNPAHFINKRNRWYWQK